MNRKIIRSSDVVKVKSRRIRKSTKKSSTKKEEFVRTSRKNRASSTKPKIAKVGKKKKLTRPSKSLSISGFSETDSTSSARSIESDLKVSIPDKVAKKSELQSSSSKDNLIKATKSESNSMTSVKSKISREALLKRPRVSADYQPGENEPFMNAKQLAYFKNKLLDWREELLRETFQTLANLQETSVSEPDLADRASAESDRSLELRARERERKLVSKIDEALLRIEEGTYGYCEETDEPIGLKRLQARPIATLSLEAQERHERRERVYRDE